MKLPLLLFTLTGSIVAVRISPKHVLGEPRSGSSLVQVENANEAAEDYSDPENVAIRLNVIHKQNDLEDVRRDIAFEARPEKVDKTPPIPKQSKLLETYSGLRFEQLIVGDESFAWKEYPEALNPEISEAYMQYQAESAAASEKGKESK